MDLTNKQLKLKKKNFNLKIKNYKKTATNKKETAEIMDNKNQCIRMCSKYGHFSQRYGNLFDRNDRNFHYTFC